MSTEFASIAKRTAPAFFAVVDLHAYYGESYIVQGVSFSLQEGEILALLGRHGEIGRASWRERV